MTKYQNRNTNTTNAVNYMIHLTFIHHTFPIIFWTKSFFTTSSPTYNFTSRFCQHQSHPHCCLHLIYITFYHVYQHFMPFTGTNERRAHY